MKSIEDLLRHLARPEVLEFGLVTNRLPSVNVGGKFEPVDDAAPDNARVLEMLAKVGGQRHLEGPTDKPLQWTTRLDGVGTIAVAAIVRGDVIQARFTVARRDAAPARPSVPMPATRSSEGPIANARPVMLAAPGGARAAEPRPPVHPSGAPGAPSAPPPAPPIQPQPIQNVGTPPSPPPASSAKVKTAPIGSAAANALAAAVAQTAGAPVDPKKTLPNPVTPPPPPAPPPAEGEPPSSEEEWDHGDDDVTVQTTSPPVAGRPGEPRSPIAEAPPPIIPRIPDSARTQILGSLPSRPPAPPATASAPPPPPEPPLPKVEITAPVDTFLAVAVAGRASDLFLVAGRPLLLRVGLDLVPRTQPVLAEHVERMAKEIVPPRLREALERDGACDFAIEHPAHGRFRVHVARQRAGYELALRVVPRDLPTPAALGVPEGVLRCLREPGLVLLASPIGHGKSTTLAALVDHVNQERAVHVLTLEDPIEHVHARRRALVTQRDLGLHVRRRQRAYASTLREDADVLVVSDLRDVDGARVALAAAEGGRLVLATLAASTTARAVAQVLDLFGEAERAWATTTLARSLRAVVVQRLVAGVAGARAHAAFELLPWSAQLSGALRAGRTDAIAEALAGGRAFGVVRFEDSLAELVRADKISLEAARRAAPSREALERYLAAPPGASVPPRRS